MINADPGAWYENNAESMGPEACEDIWTALRDPKVVRGMIEDYRAGLTVDREADDLDSARGKTIKCPVLVGWSTRDDMEDLSSRSSRGRHSSHRRLREPRCLI